ncbi:MAG TPA: peptidase S10 [Amaricoccus sp.]|nr:peptidase S10 [Amaricoccus sp.]
MFQTLRRLAAPLALLAVVSAPLPAQPAPERDPPREAAVAAAGDRLPAAVTTRHPLALPGGPIAIEATAGALVIDAADRTPDAEIAYVAYRLAGADPATRPVTFAVNGGPGAASAYLSIGAIGPWRLPMDPAGPVPSQDPELVANAETWLPFTDLVFVDPVGTGFSRLIDPDDAKRGRYLSVDGDVEALSQFIRKWLVANGRIGSPRYFVGESYGGFRGPLVASALQEDEGLALDGLVLVSPVLDFGWWQQAAHTPWPEVALLPSLAAAAMEAEGRFSPEGLAAAEDYAAGAFVTDLLRGVGDGAAVARLVDRVGALTGLDPATVAATAGRIDAEDFARAARKATGRRMSVYDAAVLGAEPLPGRRGRAGDPVLDAMTAPLTTAMLGHYRDTLGWLPDRRYMLLNRGVSSAWDWGEGRGQPEAVGALADALALDPALRVLVAHGATDLVTPYFGSELILRQLPGFGAGGRLRLSVYRGGHMFYLRDDARAAFRDDARALYAGRDG